ncbi:hypothetical protein IJ531_00170 [bacterium]|nr:hypothetical protein [bacterium]
MGGVSLTDRLVSALSYYTCGIFSIIWIVFANVTNKRMTPYLTFNLYQAIFLSVALAVISLIYSIAANILVVIPFLGGMVKSFNLFFNQTPLYFGFTLSGFIVTLILTYLALFSLLGKRPYIPLISDIINTNFGG